MAQKNRPGRPMKISGNGRLDLDVGVSVKRTFAKELARSGVSASRFASDIFREIMSGDGPGLYEIYVAAQQRTVTQPDR